MDYQEYVHDFLETLRNDSAINGTDTEDEFLNRVMELLLDFEEIVDPYRFGMGDKKGKGNRLMRADGYCFDETDHSLVLFISDFQDSFEAPKLTMSRVDELYWRLYYFLDETCNGQMDDYFDASDDILKIVRLIRKRMTCNIDDPELILKIKFYVLTNKELDTALLDANLLETTVRKRKGDRKPAKTTKKIKKADFNGKPLEINLWYPERFYEMETSNNNEPIIIDIKADFPELGLPGIPCIKGDIGDNLGYEAYIAIIPGKLLADIYIAYGSKVLEGNVRAFLGTRGKRSVNSEIKKTINNDPTKFFTYNNGIATTAADVTVEMIGGQLLITRVVDLQIINGGQTTASLSEAVLKKTNESLEGIFVPMKLTVIEDRETESEDGVRFYDQTVQAIARYANSQNKVTLADFFSNDPFHVWLERASKKYLAPPVQNAIPTGWYYERSRKKYEQEKVKLRGDEAKRFEKKFPKNQVITKEQLAVYLTAVACKPHIVSKGKNWVMREFGDDICKAYRTNRDGFNELYFRKCVCAAIIFRSVDHYLESNKDSAKRPTGFWYKSGGYKLNIVPYTIAKILSKIPKGFSLNWDKIWQKQGLSSAFMHEIEIVTKQTNDFICDSHGVIVTEFCKRESTWTEYEIDSRYSPSEEFISELIPLSLVKEDEISAKKDQKETNDLQVIMEAMALGASYWQRLLSAGVSCSMLSNQEQGFLKQMAQLSLTGNIPASASGKVPYRTMNLVKAALSSKDKLESEGILVPNG